MALKTFKLSIVVMASAFLFSCSPRLVGTWTVQRFETTTPGEQGVSLQNIGTIKFKKGGSGEKNINYNALGVSYNDQNPFKWTWDDDKYVTIEGKDTQLSKTWIIMTNKRTFQKWKSTDGTNNIQVIELKK
ncbi:MAG TPA: hypothetical protein PL009_13580 [Flavipsychrobacter sp.]|nr:hypothetical protein [Flavipsychrobacter sp.]